MLVARKNVQNIHTPAKVLRLMKDQVTPRQLARAIQVSESTVKRWCDQGKISAVKTAGRHRRIQISEAIRFVRSNDYQLARPELLGLPATTGQTMWVVNRAMEQFREALVAGDAQLCRQIVFDLYLARHSCTVICDQMIAKTFHWIGDQWECGSAEVYQERRGCETCTRILHELWMATPPPPENAPLAIGGTAPGDQYILPTTMVELVLRELGWRAVSLGTSLPFETLKAAATDNQPRLFWLSVSHVPDTAAFLEGYADLYKATASKIALVVGGRELTEPLRQQMKYASYCDNLQHLESFVATLSDIPRTLQPRDPNQRNDATSGDSNTHE